MGFKLPIDVLIKHGIDVLSELVGFKLSNVAFFSLSTLRVLSELVGFKHVNLSNLVKAITSFI